MAQTLKLQDAGDMWRQVMVSCLQEKKECIVLDEQDRPIAVVLSIEDYENYQALKIEDPVEKAMDEVQAHPAFFDEIPVALFDLKWRQGPRVTAQWRMDLQLPGADHSVELCTFDIGADGVCLQGAMPAVFDQAVAEKRRMPMQLHLPDSPEVLQIEAELKWARKEGDPMLTGWAFTRITPEGRRAIEEYIEAHPEDILKDAFDE